MFNHLKSKMQTHLGGLLMLSALKVVPEETESPVSE